MRILFAGTPGFAVPSLVALHDSRHEVVGVVSKKDSPKGRSRKPVWPEVKKAAAEREIPVFQPRDIKTQKFLDILEELGVDMITVVAYGKLFPATVLETPPMGCVNVHSSLLPKYRGAAPINWAVARGEEKTGVTTMLMDEGMDTGDILLQKEVSIGNDETAEDLATRLSVLGARLLVETVDLMEKGRITPRSQDDSLATRAPILSRKDGEVDWKTDAREIRNLARGMTPWPRAHTTLEGKNLTIFRAEVAEGNGEPGQIMALEKGSLDVAAGQGIVRIFSLQPEGGKKMEAAEFLRGRNLREGQFLGTS